jgi:hypothetical protein
VEILILSVTKPKRMRMVSVYTILFGKPEGRSPHRRHGHRRVWDKKDRGKETGLVTKFRLESISATHC